MDKTAALARRHGDLMAILVLLGTLLFFGIYQVDFEGPPFEDAAMLMRYAENLAHGHGIVWNVGEAPVDGATDFLFMVSASILMQFGLATGRAIRVLGLGAHVLAVLLVYFANRRIWKANIVVSMITALYLAVGTGLWYVAAYFGTPVFALSACVTWYLALVLLRMDQPARWIPWAFAFSGWIMGLIRPEGVILACLMLLSILIVRSWRRSRSIVLIFLTVMMVLGGTYLVWRWSYFGYPLPNPYYKKGGGLLHWDSFWESLGYLIRFAGPFTLAFVLGLRSRQTLRLTVSLLLPVVLFAMSFVLVSNETNFGGRFQYAVWPLVLMSYYPLVKHIDAETGWDLSRLSRGSAKWAWLLTGLVLALGLLRYATWQACSLTAQQQACGIGYESDGRYDVAKMLAEYREKGYVIATTEAGLLPLYSGWTAIDTWGLNDVWIAHHGEVTAEYLDRYAPQLIVFHAYFSPIVAAKTKEKDLEHAWHRMTLVLKDYAESNDYVLAAAFGDSPYESHYYYVRRDFPDSDTIAREISTMKNYRWFATGRKAINYEVTR